MLCRFRSRKGSTLIEALFAATVFLIASISVLYSYVKCLELDQLGQAVNTANLAVKSKIEEIKASPFNSIYSTYNNTSFDVAGMTGKGVIYVDNANSKLLQIKVVYCWQLVGGRIVGEDTNLNGVLNAGEDLNANGELDSYVQITTKIYG